MWLDEAAFQPRKENEETGEITRKRRTLLAFEASRVLENSMICEILNYLLASLVRSSFAELGRVLVAWTPNPKPGFPMRRNIPAQRNHAVACECIGYVLNEVIGDEGKCYYSSDVKASNVFLLFLQNASSPSARS